MSEAQDFVDQHIPRWLHTSGTTVVRQFAPTGVNAERFPHLTEWRSGEIPAARRHRVRHPQDLAVPRRRDRAERTPDLRARFAPSRSCTLREEYRDSASEIQCLDPSRRVGEEEVRHRGLELRVLTCPRNTLVIANTCGYHARAVGEAGATPRALHMSFRYNPFWYPMPNTSRVVRATTKLLRRRT